MREERPIIALDFPAFEDVKNFLEHFPEDEKDRKSTRLNSSHIQKSRMPSSA